MVARGGLERVPIEEQVRDAAAQGMLRWPAGSLAARLPAHPNTPRRCSSPTRCWRPLATPRPAATTTPRGAPRSLAAQRCWRRGRRGACPAAGARQPAAAPARRSWPPHPHPHPPAQLWQVCRDRFRRGRARGGRLHLHLPAGAVCALSSSMPALPRRLAVVPTALTPSLVLVVALSFWACRHSSSSPMLHAIVSPGHLLPP